MNTLEAPYDYRLARVNRMPTTPPAYPADYAHYHTKLRDLAGTSTDRIWEVVRLLLAGIDHLEDVSPISRVELFSGRNRRGLMLFDNTGAALLHVPLALLGYSGSGPILSEQILTALGVSKEMFREACSAANYDHGYMVIFSREEIQKVEGVEAAIPRGELGEWRWWPAPLM